MALGALAVAYEPVRRTRTEVQHMRTGLPRNYWEPSNHFAAAARSTAGVVAIPAMVLLYRHGLLGYDSD